MRILFENLDKTTARGIEQAIINLNTHGLPALSLKIDNISNSTSFLRHDVYWERLKAGTQYLDDWSIKSGNDWRTFFKY